MPVIEWAAAYSVNNEAMDGQHQRLFKAVNELYDSINSATPDARQALQCIKFLTEYTRTHFADEESLMRDRNYSGLTAHQAEHELVLKQLRGFERLITVATRESFVEDDMILFLLGDWLLDHVLSSDQAYAAVL